MGRDVLAMLTQHQPLRTRICSLVVLTLLVSRVLGDATTPARGSRLRRGTREAQLPEGAEGDRAKYRQRHGLDIDTSASTSDAEFVEGAVSGAQRGFEELIATPTRSLQADTAEQRQRCSTSPGYLEGRPLVGERANNYLAFAQKYPGRVRAWDPETPISITSGCPFHYYLLKGDTIHIELQRESAEHMLTVDWDQKGMFAVALMSWAKHGDPFVQPGMWIYGASNRWDAFIWQRSMTGDSAFHMKRNKRDFFHCTAGCSDFQATSHNGTDGGRLLVTLDTQFEGDYLTEFSGVYRFDFHQRPTPLLREQYEVVRELYMTNCAPFRNGTDPQQPFNTWWDWTLHQQTVHRDPDLKPYCDWLIDSGWNPAWEALLDDEVWDHNEDGLCAQVDEIECDNSGYIKGIYLSTAGLRGHLPANLSHLVQMREFNVPYNQLDGPLPEHLLEHGALQDLVIYHNLFTGTLPCFAGEPLRRIQIDWNKFSGSFPNCLGQLTNLQVFEAYNTHIQGSIPEEFAQLVNLRRFGVGSNLLTGTFPHFFCNFAYLEYLDISSNQFDGPFPADCLQKPRFLYALHADYNRFIGSLPPLSGEMTALEVLDLGHNYFTGEVNSQLDAIMKQTVRSLRSIHLNDNLLSGSLNQNVLVTSTYDPQVRFKITLNDNFFRCEKAGHWPEWAQRLGHVDLGKCMPVAHPRRISPGWGPPGTRITVFGNNFVPSRSPSCFFFRGVENRTSLAVYHSEHEISCYVPSSITPEGPWVFTVANFGEDYASRETVEHFTSIVFIVTKPPPRQFGAYVTMEMAMSSKFESFTVEAFNEPNFQAALAQFIGTEPQKIVVQPENIVVHGPVRDRCLRLVDRLGSHNCIDVNVSILLDDKPQAWAVKNKLVDIARTTTEDEYLLPFTTNAIQVNAMHIDTVRIGTKGAVTQEQITTKNGAPVGAIAAISVIITVITVVCCSVSWLIWREKQGKPYFKESLDDSTASFGSINPLGDGSGPVSRYGNGMDPGSPGSPHVRHFG